MRTITTYVTEVLAAAGWARPHFKKLDIELDIAAGRGLEVAVVQSAQIAIVNSWLRNQPAEVASAAIASLCKALGPYVNGASVRLPGADVADQQRTCLSELHPYQT